MLSRKPQLFTAIHLLALLSCLTGVNAQESTDSTISDEEIIAFLDDPSILLGSTEDTETTGLAIQSGPLLSSSVRVGAGHSDNFLKKYAELTASDYIQVETDVFASWRLQQLEMSAIAFAEATLYSFDLEPSDETLAYTRINGVLSKGIYDFGFESSLLYGSFIYDSSLTAVSAPSGTQIRQLRPTVSFFAHWYAPGANRVRLELSTSRSQFNLENQDYWDPEVRIELDHVWSSSLITSSQLAYSRQLYDDDVGRTAGGIPVEQESSLIVERVTLNQKLNWTPERWRWLQIDINLGLAWEDENVGSYEAMRQSWIRGRMTINNSFGRFRFSGKWGEYRYENRLVSQFDRRLHLQTNQSLTIEYGRSLPWNLEVLLRGQWNGLKSRIFQDTYSERRTEFLMQWSY